MAGMTLEWQVFLKGIEHRINDTIGEINSAHAEGNEEGVTFFIGQLQAFREVHDYIKREMK